MNGEGWKAKVVQAAVIMIVIGVGARIAYEAAKPLILPAVVILVLVGLSALVLRRR
ncbi:hypothetical protein [Parafrankia sp. BMG5.11]|uniref:hypothetical protein n=1 Tax=Parafrankia sp. BMG5.11 TaxID=222540 RepID=UPI001404FCD4|nr:hypothetical protein [Parafrankia sp. BMG5.11]